MQYLFVIVIYKRFVLFFLILLYIIIFFLNFISGLPRFIPKREREKYLIEDINKLNENNINKERERNRIKYGGFKYDN